MKFFRFVAVFFLCTLFTVLCTSRIHAAQEFSVDSTVTYNIQDSGITQVTHDISLENNLSILYATSYSLTFNSIDAENISAQDVKGNTIPTSVSKDGDMTSVKINFSDALVGQGQKRHFFVFYTNSSFAVKTGDIWEVSIPRLGEQNVFRSYRVVLKVPSSFGLEAYISPKPLNSDGTNGSHTYTYDDREIKNTGISAGFGQFQVFSFNLAYHLENPLAKSSQTQISLPPDTAFQKVFIQKLDPAPSNVTVDPDGNWLATYILTPRQRVDVVATGTVQIFAGFRSFPKPSAEVLSNNLKAQEFWQTDDPQIKKLAQELKTPKAIYDYVSQTLKYDFARVTPDVKRMGAVSALKNPTQAICMEFTDLFIAIARDAGIPAREINGFAYTENHDLQPLSLVADVLHAWPEYYDKSKGVWVPIDPTWASTSGGIDYFDKLDLRHFTFVIHGESDITPYAPGSYKLGPNPQKDVFVSFGKLPDNRTSELGITISPKRTLPFFDSIYSANIVNPGPAAIYSVRPTIIFDNKEVDSSLIDIVPPYSNWQMPITVHYSFLGKSTPNVIELRADTTSAKFTTNKSQIVTISLLTIFAVFIVFMILLLIYLKKIRFRGLSAKIASIWRKPYDKFTKRPGKDSNNP